MWGKPDALDRLAQGLVAFAALIALGNGLFMLASPFGWYDWVGTVKATGPANGHFIRDIGLAYLVCAALLLRGAINLPMRWGSALAGAAWLALHGGLHVWEVASGLCAVSVFWQEAPGTLGPPLLALAGVALQLGRQRVSPGPLPSRITVALFDQRTGGLSPNIRDFAAAPGHLMEKFAHFMAIATHRHAATAEQAAMARLGAVQIEDCGPCVEIVARGALEAGLARDLINAALRGDLPEGPARQAWCFGQAIAAGDPDVTALGEAIETQYGRPVRTELAVAAATARTHPAFKRGLGYAQSCAVMPLQV